MENYRNTDNITNDIGDIILSAQQTAYKTVDAILLQRNWLIGKRIAEEELDGKNRSEIYGVEIIKKLSIELTEKYGKGYTKTNLYSFYLFYKEYKDIFHPMSGKSSMLLSWTHYRILLQVHDIKARAWYEKEAYGQTWSTKTLQRNINTQYYYRLLQSRNKSAVESEMKDKTLDYQNDKLEFLKNPIIAEFMGLSSNTDMTENDLETAILNNLQKFLMELGKGYAFVARQQHIHTEKEDYYIDLVFYNYILKCFVLIDLKSHKLTHQDIGQMDMYIRMFDDLKKQEDDNPTIGIIFCTDKDETMVKYSVLNESEQIFASKYMTVLPTAEELKDELERNQLLYSSENEA